MTAFIGGFVIGAIVGFGVGCVMMVYAFVQEQEQAPTRRPPTL